MKTRCAAVVVGWGLLTGVACLAADGVAPPAVDESLAVDRSAAVDGSAAAPPATASGDAPQQPATPQYGYEVVDEFPHDPMAFTQGLLFHDDSLYEGTGRRGQSSLRQLELGTGRVLRRADLPAQFFGEGITILGDEVFQLTWLSGIGVVWDLETFTPRRQFRQFTEGWGLTTDGTHLIQSDGSTRLYFLDPADLSAVREVEVRDADGPVDQINELEYVDGEIWANVWHSDDILRIGARDGRVLGRIDMSGLMTDPAVLRDPEAVLNGIAYDPARGRIFVTGKLWPTIYEIRVVGGVRR